jgi:hypothetical protein
MQVSTVEYTCEKQVVTMKVLLLLYIHINLSEFSLHSSWLEKFYTNHSPSLLQSQTLSVFRGPILHKILVTLSF